MSEILGLHAHVVDYLERGSEGVDEVLGVLYQAIVSGEMDSGVVGHVITDMTKSTSAAKDLSGAAFKASFDLLNGLVELVHKLEEERRFVNPAVKACVVTKRDARAVFISELVEAVNSDHVAVADTIRKTNGGAAAFAGS